MSYCRFGEAEIYLYLDCYGYICCCSCALEHGSKALYSTDDALDHIAEHRKVGHFVPAHVDEELREDRQEDEDFIATRQAERQREIEETLETSDPARDRRDAGGGDEELANSKSRGYRG